MLSSGFSRILSAVSVSAFSFCPEVSVVQPQIIVGHIIARIRLRPQLIGLCGLVDLPGHQSKVVSGDGQLISLTDSLAQIVRRLDVLAGQRGLPRVQVGNSQTGEGHSEVGVKFDGTLEKQNCSRIALRGPGFYCQRVGLQCFERRCCGFLDRCVVFLNRAERFTNFLLRFTRHQSVERIQYVLFFRDLHLLLADVEPPWSGNPLRIAEVDTCCSGSQSTPSP